MSNEIVNSLNSYKFRISEYSKFIENLKTGHQKLWEFAVVMVQNFCDKYGFEFYKTANRYHNEYCIILDCECLITINLPEANGDFTNELKCDIYNEGREEYYQNAT